MKRIGLLPLLLLAACQHEMPPLLPDVVLGPNPIEPLWSRYGGCSYGIQISAATVTAANRFEQQYQIFLICDGAATRLTEAD